MSPSSLPQLVAIVGPTASGKTNWALELAREFNGEIVSADSRQIYRGLSIGTSKPSGTWRSDTYVVQGIPYHLVDLVDPDEEFTLAHYQRRAFEIIDAIIARSKLPLLVGGTGLYVQAVIDNVQMPAVPPNEALRKRLSRKSVAELTKLLEKVDPKTAQVIDPNNPRRLIRALEVALTTKRSFSQLGTKAKPRYDTLQIGIAKPKEELYEMIERRVDEMIEAGLVHEVEALLTRYSRTLPALSGIGYAEISQYLDGDTTLEKTIRLIKTHTRQYARRQLTWFKRDKRIHWTSTLAEARQLIRTFLVTKSHR